MKIKIVLIILCVASTTQTGAMQDTPKKRTYDETSTNRLSIIVNTLGWINHENEVMQLLENGADPEKSELLHLTLNPRHFGFLKKALECGANPNSVNEKGDTLLHKVFDVYQEEGQQASLALLLLAGADSTIKNKKGRTVLEELEECHPQHTPTFQAVIAAVPIVKKERDAYNPGVVRLVNVHLPQPITGITMDFVGPLPIWDDGCWDLFEKHMAQARKSDQAKRLK